MWSNSLEGKTPLVKLKMRCEARVKSDLKTIWGGPNLKTLEYNIYNIIYGCRNSCETGWSDKHEKDEKKRDD